MAGEREILAKLDEVTGRLATAKSVGDLQELVGRMATSKSLIEIQEQQGKILSELKTLKERLVEIEESNAKEHKKTRAEAEEAAGQFEETDDSKPPEWAVPFLEEVKGLFSYGKGIIGDKEVSSVLKRKVIKFLTKAEAEEAE